MATTDEVLYSVAERVATITINRPQRKNAITEGVVAELGRFLGEAASDEQVGAVVLRGADGNFCAGADLGGGIIGDTAPSFLEMHANRGGYARLLEAMNACPRPILAVVEGYCLAGGMGLLLASDLAVAADDAKLGTPEIKRGLWPYMVTALLIRHLGRKKALELCMLGERISGAEAARLGLVNASVPADQLEEKVHEMAVRLAAMSPAIMALGKGSFYRIADMATPDALAYLQSQLTINAQTEDMVEGITAFFEKREPRWKGR